MTARVGAASPSAAELQHRIAHAASILGLSLGPTQTAKLTAFVALLDRWNRTYNLTAIVEAGAMVGTHIADCLSAVAPLRRELERRAAPGEPALLDVGSGGGLPGVVLALAEPAWQVTCVDSVGKKAAFITQVAAELGIPKLRAVHARVEAIPGPPFDAVVCRAFSSLRQFVGATRHLTKPDGFWMAMKGRMESSEATEPLPDVSVFHVEPVMVPGLEAERNLVFLESKR